MPPGSAPGGAGSGSGTEKAIELVAVSDPAIAPSPAPPVSARGAAPTATLGSHRPSHPKQLGAIMRKNLAYQKRQYVTNGCQIFCPVFLVLVMLLLQFVVSQFLSAVVLCRYYTIIGNQAGIGQATEIKGVAHPPFSTTRFYSVPYSFLPSEEECLAAVEGLPEQALTNDTSVFLKDISYFVVAAQPASDDRAGALVLSPPTSYAKSGLLGNYTGPSTLLYTYTMCQQLVMSTVGFNTAKWASKTEADAGLFAQWFTDPQPLAGYYMKRLQLHPRGSGAVTEGKVLHYGVYYNGSSLFGGFGGGSGDKITDWLDQIAGAALHTITNKLHTLVYLGRKSFPTADRTRTLDIISSALAMPFYMLIFQLMLPLMVGSIVYEKEQKLRQIQKMMGLRDIHYWLSTLAFHIILFFISEMVIVGISILCGFRIVSLNDISVWIVLLLCWGWCLSTAAALASSLFGKPRSAHIIGYIYVFASTIISLAVIGDLLDDSTTTPGTVFAIQLLPSFAFYRALTILSRNVSNDGPGLRFMDAFGEESAMAEVWLFLIVEGAVFLLLLWYTEKVLPSSGTANVPQHPLFCFQPSYWSKSNRAGVVPPITGSSEPPAISTAGASGATGAGSHEASAGATDASLACHNPACYSSIEVRQRGAVYRPADPRTVTHEPSDVKAQREALIDGRHGATMVFLDVTKIYDGAAKDPHALRAADRVCLSIKPNECFGFLGPNGAGKSTLMNIASGLIQPTGGTVLVGEYNIDHDTDVTQIHAHMGVCPQDDLLWGDLTAAEHLTFYAQLKNVSIAAMKQVVDNALVEVDLHDPETRRKTVKQFSGGMKRRLSVACALIGSPRVVLLDEPTTGLDPANRRKLWDVIRSHKSRNAVILLTTHAMEEADYLCDRIAIINHGTLRCLGKSADLKSRFGKGYRLTVTVSSDDAKQQRERVDGVERFVLNTWPGARMLNTLAGTMNFEAPKDQVPLSQLFGLMNSHEEELFISDWGVSNTTLEEVFLRVTADE